LGIRGQRPKDDLLIEPPDQFRPEVPV
jgi:hypothetical protein